MSEVLELNRDDQHYKQKKDVLNHLINSGGLDEIKAKLRAKVIEQLEAEKKKSRGAASKYMKGSEIQSNITRKVVEHPDGLLCAEIIREFLSFYKMNLSLNVFEPEMSISSTMAKSHSNIERELGFGPALSGDRSKPILLTLLEQFKYGNAGSGGQGSVNPHGSVPSNNLESSPSYKSPFSHSAKDEPPAPERPKTAKNKSPPPPPANNKAAEPPSSAKSALSTLNDLPSLGNPKKATVAANDFDEFGLNDDEDADSDKLKKISGSKYNNSKAQKLLKDHEDEEHKGYNVRVQKRGHVYTADDDDIQEEIQSEDQDPRGQNTANKNSGGGESSSARGFGITVSQSLGIDKSVDSMAIDEYDHIEDIE
ncbi:hypothetical protein FGO68_gene6451 [Halteria grandinella]|uniref:FGFR1 oncogene partner (FOP) N-terminal dimerisation domain-containing protein n=1 Tax=Halteria grandinella TaxID=5974 RepID=A0A8J8NMS4_HALGN|nr:hypothetical protein FGO68_gene6451 [Halteria grandinella]